MERVEDDYATDEYDSDESEITSEVEYSDEEQPESDDDSFVVSDEELKSDIDEVDNGEGEISDTDTDADATGPADE